MNGRVSATYALRSLFRHTRRTVLSVVGVGVGCAIGMFAVSWITGATIMEIQAATESGAGDLKIVPQGWLATRDDKLRLAHWQETLATVKKLPGLASLAVRARSSGLLGLGNRTAGVVLTGVDPEQEARCNRVVRRARIRGRYLSSEGGKGEVVLGRRLAEHLGARVGDDLYLTLAGRKEITGAMLRLVGIAETGSREIDGAFCQVHWQDVQRLTGYPGIAEISILLRNHSEAKQARAWLAQHLHGTNKVITWRQVDPTFAAGMAGDQAFTAMLVLIILVVVSLGIASAQLTAVLERRREFGVLTALGMKSGQIIALMLFEALVIGVGGACVALVLGGGAAYLLSTKGISFAAMMGGDTSFGGILLDPVLHGSFGLWVLWYALAVSVFTTVLASIYPAWLATRANPAEAVRVT